MGAYDFGGLGNKAINSTGAGVVANPSTSSLIAEIDSTQLGTQNFKVGQDRTFRVSWILGADTNATWQCETATDTGLGSGVDVVPIKTATAQSGQFVTMHSLTKDMRIRARLFSSLTGTVTAFLSAEPLV
jgi:hypothetical protein